VIGDDRKPFEAVVRVDACAAAFGRRIDHDRSSKKKKESDVPREAPLSLYTDVPFGV
jgi:hypothetical protein